MNEKPKPPSGAIIIEGSLSRCPICNSTEKRNWYFKKIGCINPDCENYYKRVRI
jgi:hypothetical protein